MKQRAVSLFLCLIFCVSLTLPASAAYISDPQTAADALYSLGLFKGTGANPDGTPDFSLDETANRAMAITMLIRLLGGETAAASGSWTHPFTDVSRSGWANSYIGYAYQMGLTRGVDGGTAFAPDEKVSLKQYLTFVLRALGYDDSAGDFTYQSADTFARSLGLIQGTVQDEDTLSRGDVAVISCNALNVLMKGSDMTLAEYLTAKGVIQTSSGTSTLPDAVESLTGAQISQLCSPAVFYIEVYNSAGQASASGSGFFITGDGIAVTCYHVIEGSASAAVTTKTGDIYPVTKVLYGDKDRDIAILRVSGTSTTGTAKESFPYLTAGDSDSVLSGETVYALGSPLGLSDSITTGLISNTNRMVDGYSYLQTDAAISSGSSGGALVTSTGKVIGITAATLVDGQNLNLAIPINAINSADLSTDGVTYSLSATTGAASSGSSSGSTVTSGIAVSQSSVSLKTGAFITLTVSDVNNVSTRITCSSSSSVIQCQWGDWSSNNISIPLTITGVSAGTATVTISLLDAYNRTLATAAVSVTVTGSSTSISMYAAYPTVPDFGAMLGISPDLSDEKGYYYELNSVYAASNGSTAINDYCTLLEQCGFSLYRSVETEDANLILLSNSSGRIIAFGLITSDTITYIAVLIVS